MRVKSLSLLATAFVLAGCVSHPTAPVMIDRVTITGPTSAYVGSSVPYTATLNFSPQSMLDFHWIFDTANVMDVSKNQVVQESRTFTKTGQNVVQLQVFATDHRTILCTASDTTTILPAEIAIISDTSKLHIEESRDYHIRLLHGKLPPSATVRWTIDTSTVIATYANDSGNITHRYSTQGSRSISASVLDSSNQVIASALMLLNVQPLDLAVLSSFDTIDVIFKDRHIVHDCAGNGFTWVNDSSLGKSEAFSISPTGGFGYLGMGNCGQIAKNLLALDTFGFSYHTEVTDWGHCWCSAEGRGCIVTRTTYSLSLLLAHNIPLLSYCPDSVVYGLSSLQCQNNVVLHLERGQYLSGCECSDCETRTDTNCIYNTTVWTSPTLRITLRK